VGDIVIAGIGNPFRSDDGVGWAVADRLSGRVPSNVHVCKQRGECAQLFDLFGQFSIVYLIDACQGTGAPGSWHRLLWADSMCDTPDTAMVEPVPTSTHGLGVFQAIALARALNSLPARLIVYAIVTQSLQLKTALSPAVARGVPLVAQAIRKELYA
jgi:hydrogenase maturation protease